MVKETRRSPRPIIDQPSVFHNSKVVSLGVCIPKLSPRVVLGKVTKHYTGECPRHVDR